MTQRHYVTVNPCNMCQPMGSVLAFKGIEKSMVLLHGSQGCSTYMRLHLAHHFREPVDIASSSMSEKGAVYGGSENLKKGLRNMIMRYRPKIIGVATTCMAETIGDDIPGIIREFREEEDTLDEVQIIPVSTPSYNDSHVKGYTKAVDAIVRNLTKHAHHQGSGDRINIILAENVSPADARELKQIASDIAGSFILLPDISETLDGPLGCVMPFIARGGTSVDDIADMANSRITIGLGISAGNPASEYLRSAFCIPCIDVPLPIGLKHTDLFFEMLSGISGTGIPEKYKKERGRLLDAMVDVHKYLFGIRAAIFGDPDTVLGLLSIILELGMHPVLVAAGSRSKGFEKAARSYIEDIRPLCETSIVEGYDFDAFNDAVRKIRPDILIGNSRGKYISNAENIPLVRTGLPIHDRVGAQRLLMAGYRGAVELIDRITNTIIEANESKSIRHDAAYEAAEKACQVLDKGGRIFKIYQNTE